MKKVEVDPVVLIIYAIMFLIACIITGAVSVGKRLTKKFKNQIEKLRAVHKEDLSAEKNKFSNDLAKKDEIIKKKDGIIEELLDLLQEKDEKGRSLIDTTLGLKTFNIITKQRRRLNGNHGLVG